MKVFVVAAGREFRRKKILIAVLALSFLFLGVFAYGIGQIPASGFGPDPLARLLSSLLLAYFGLFFSMLAIALLVFFATMGAVSGEIENGLLLSVLARPYPRWRYFLGRWTGYAVWIGLYSAAMFSAILAILHAEAGLNVGWDGYGKGLLLFVLIPLILSALSLVGSTYLPMLGNGVACGMLFSLSLFSGFAVPIFEANGRGLWVEKLDLITSLLLPADAVFRRMTYELMGGKDLLSFADAARQLGPFAPSAVPSAAFVAYAVGYLAALLIWGCRRFNRMDIA